MHSQYFVKGSDESAKKKVNKNMSKVMRKAATSLLLHVILT